MQINHETASAKNKTAIIGSSVWIIGPDHRLGASAHGRDANAGCEKLPIITEFASIMVIKGIHMRHPLSLVIVCVSVIARAGVGGQRRSH